EFQGKAAEHVHVDMVHNGLQNLLFRKQKVEFLLQTADELLVFNTVGIPQSAAPIEGLRIANPLTDMKRMFFRQKTVCQPLTDFLRSITFWKIVQQTFLGRQQLKRKQKQQN